MFVAFCAGVFWCGRFENWSSMFDTAEIVLMQFMSRWWLVAISHYSLILIHTHTDEFNGIWYNFPIVWRKKKRCNSCLYPIHRALISFTCFHTVVFVVATVASEFFPSSCSIQHNKTKIVDLKRINLASSNFAPAGETFARISHCREIAL